jgi:AP-2 complex subunit alpha
VAAVGGKEFAESLAADVQRLLVTGAVRPIVRKKAALCLLRLFRRNPDVLNKDEWCAVTVCPPATCAVVWRALTRGPCPTQQRRADALPTLLDERDYGLLTSVLSLLQGLVAADSSRCGGR